MAVYQQDIEKNNSDKFSKMFITEQVMTGCVRSL